VSGFLKENRTNRYGTVGQTVTEPDKKPLHERTADKEEKRAMVHRFNLKKQSVTKVVKQSKGAFGGLHPKNFLLIQWLTGKSVVWASILRRRLYRAATLSRNTLFFLLSRRF